MDVGNNLGLIISHYCQSLHISRTSLKFPLRNFFLPTKIPLQIAVDNTNIGKKYSALVPLFTKSILFSMKYYAEKIVIEKTSNEKNNIYYNHCNYCYHRMQ